MKNLAAVLLLFALCSHMVCKLFLVSNYWLNKEAITALYCVNKAKPQLNCNGKCHLAKQLKSTESKDAAANTQPEKEQHLFFYTEYIAHSGTISFEPILTKIKALQKLDSCLSGYCLQVFRPPVVA